MGVIPSEDAPYNQDTPVEPAISQVEGRVRVGASESRDLLFERAETCNLHRET